MALNEQLITKVTKAQLRLEHPDFNSGDTIRVQNKIKEAGGKERLQNYEGIVMKIQGRGASKTFTVRKDSFGVGVEKTFFYNSPMIAKIQIVKKGKVRRSRIFYMRTRSGKSARIQEKE